jgi:hypothetical protein
MVKKQKEGNMYSLDICDANSINLNSCCGGCYAMQGLHYCPYCGKKIKVKKNEF